MRSIPILALCTLLAACSASDDATTPELREGTVRVQSRDSTAVDITAIEPIKLGTNALMVAFPSRAGTELASASALMPAHGHGSKSPTIERSAEGYRVSNLVLFMSGRWEVRFVLRAGGHDDEALVTIDVP